MERNQIDCENSKGVDLEKSATFQVKVVGDESVDGGMNSWFRNSETESQIDTLESNLAEKRRIDAEFELREMKD